MHHPLRFVRGRRVRRPELTVHRTKNGDDNWSCNEMKPVIAIPEAGDRRVGSSRHSFYFDRQLYLHSRDYQVLAKQNFVAKLVACSERS